MRNSILRLLSDEFTSRVIAGIALFFITTFFIFQWNLFCSINKVEATVQSQQIQIDYTRKSLDAINKNVEDLRNYFIEHK